MTFWEFWRATTWPDRILMAMMLIAIPENIHVLFSLRDFDYWAFWVGMSAAESWVLFANIDGILNAKPVEQNDNG